MIKKRNGRLFAVVFTVVCMFVAMLGGFVGLFNAIDTSTPVIADAATSNDYYAPLADDLNKTGTAFRTELQNLITSTHKNITSYSDMKGSSYNPNNQTGVYWHTDADPNNSGNILLFYTGMSYDWDGTFGSSKDSISREHVWCQSKANFTTSNGGADAHHIQPINQGLNGERSNQCFGEVPQTNGNIAPQFGSTSYDNLCYDDDTFFYPGEGYRGATARILMYVQTRWGGNYDLKFVLNEAKSSNSIGDIKTLMKWHIEEPPSQREIARNNAVEDVQGNRNPFIDHPEYAEMIYCYDDESYNDELQAVVQEYGSYLDDLTDDTLEVESITLSATSKTLAVGETVGLSATVKPENAVKSVTWTSSNPSVASVNANGTVTALSAGTTTITAASTKTPAVKASATITVKALSAITISGTPTKTTYDAGTKFNPTGLTVTATYSDMSTAVIPNAQMQWLDGTTRQATLSAGTTSVIAKYGNIEKNISGITVKESKNTVFTFGDNGTEGHKDGSGIGDTTYNQGSYSLTISNTTKVFGSAFDAMGNSVLKLGTSSAVGSFSFTVPSNVNSVVIYVAQYKANTTIVSVNGTTHNITTASNDGEYTPITVDTSSNKTVNFATMSGGNRCMIDKIEFIVSGASASCQHTASDWIVDSQGDCKVAGSKHKECTKCGEVLDAVEIPATNNHSWGNWQVVDIASCSATGKETRECSVCHQIETNITEKTSHDWGDWVDNGNGTETRVCSTCQEPETRSCANLSKVEAFENAVDAVASANELEAKWNAISTALSKYNGLADAEKDAASEAYALLAEHIRDYNSQVDSINADSQKATSDAFRLLASTISVLVFGAYLLLKA